MKIGINVLGLATCIAGAERYAKMMIEELLKIDDENDYVLILSEYNQSVYGLVGDNVTHEVIGLRSSSKIVRVLYEQFILPFKLKRMGIDVLYSPCNISPWFGDFRKVTMIFDMHWFLDDNPMPAWRLAYVRSLILHSAKIADHILTISEHSKKDILHFTGISEDKVTVTFLGPTPLFDIKEQVQEHSQIELLKKTHRIEKEYVLFIGQLLHRKNVDVVIKAMCRMKEEQGDLPFQFVVAGNWDTPWKSHHLIMDQVLEGGLQDDVVFVSHPSDVDLADLLLHARVFVYPSLYEGYGLPIAEALFYGIPTITSNVSSMPEVGLDACEYVDPRSIGDMEEALMRVWGDVSLREKMVKKGYQRIKQLNWQGSVHKTWQLLLGRSL